MSTVFLVQESGRIDVTPALDFGEIFTILPPGDTNFSYNFVTMKIQEAIGLRAKPGDYLLLTGDPIAIGLATVALYETLRPFTTELNFLKWLPREARYLPVKVDMAPFDDQPIPRRNLREFS